MDDNIPEKANRVLNIIILGLLLILVRVWYLTIIQHDEHLEKARKPQRRSIVEKVERATIRDRFNIPLALNKIQYNAAVCYADIRQIPSVKWETNAEGKKVRVQARAAYIKHLSELLAEELQLDAQQIEDTIHGKASLFPHTPFILKEDLSEREYARLKLIEKDWAGIRTEKGSKRYYPLGKVGCDVIGYMGAISSNEYYTIAQELKILQTYLSERESGEIAVLPKGFQNPLEVRERLKTLQEKAYTINDLVGKAGVESAFDADLRGYAGKKTYEVDTRGNLLRELPGGRQGVAGQRLLLSISSELQEFAEQLLAQNEKVRELRHPDGSADLSAPWIKGGAIVALDPKTGEVLALASYPRTDPNDFIPSRIPDVKACRQSAINKWLENEAYIAELWDGKRPLERERYHQSFYTETVDLSLAKYLEAILPPNSALLATMQKIATVGAALNLQEEMASLLRLSDQGKMATVIDVLYPEHPSRIALSQEEKTTAYAALMQNSENVSVLKAKIDLLLKSIKRNDDKLLVIDLCRLLANREFFSQELIASIAPLSLSEFRSLNQSAAIVQSFLQTHIRTRFHKKEFQEWRTVHFKEFLKEKRREEKEKRHYAKPYTDYLEQIEKQMFKAYWEKSRLELFHAFVLGKLKLETENPHIKQHAEKLNTAIAPFTKEQQLQFLLTMRSFEELKTPLYGKYRVLRNTQGEQLEKHLAAAFYPLAGYGFGRSQAFRQSSPQGSVFKLVVAYQGLLENYQKIKNQQHHFENINPLTVVDNVQWHTKAGQNDQVLGYTLDGQPILRFYKGGKLPRSSHSNIGHIDVVGAIEQSSNMYFALLAGDHMEDPLNLVNASKAFGFGEKTGIELPGEIAGLLPDDVIHNRTGLYSFAMGQHSLVVTPLQTAVMLAAIANKGEVLKPKVIQVIAGQEPLREYRDPFAQALFPFKDHLASIGIHFPLFTATQIEGELPFVWYSAPEIKRSLDIPNIIREPLIEGMHRVIIGSKGTARPNIIRALQLNPQWMRNFQELKDRFIGKTGTAEILYKQTVDAESKAYIQNHIWFVGISFPKTSPQTWENPDLVVVCYLRFSRAGGKEAAPLTAEIVKKWHEICERHGRTAYVLPEARNGINAKL